MSNIIKSKIFVVKDNIDTDQIIPAQYLTLVPTVQEEYEKLGSYALCGLPDTYEKFVPEGEIQSEYQIIVAGKNFGCGSSREHAPISLGAAGVKVIIAESFARIFFRNSISTGELYPVDISIPLINEEIKTGDYAEVNLDNSTIKINGNEYSLNLLGEAKDVIDNGGIFNHARKTGMIN